MSKVLILVEGFTEERFVKDILEPYFEPKGIFVIPRNLKGVGSYTIIRDEVNKLLHDSSASIVTTMIDLYRIPSDFPQKHTLTRAHTGIQKVAILEDGFTQDIGKDRFLSYLQLHEFEALLFSDVSMFSKLSDVGNKIKFFEKIVQEIKNPEDINDLPNTSPAERIKKILPHYTKDIFGIIVAKSIGLEKMREKCSHFNEWLEKIESLIEAE